MNYQYRCKPCNIKSEVEKAMKDSNRVELCLFCSKPMDRVYESPSILTAEGVKA